VRLTPLHNVGHNEGGGEKVLLNIGGRNSMSVSFERAAGAATLPGHGLGLGVRWPWSRIAKLGGAAAVLTLGVYAVMSIANWSDMTA